jgi:hypothetical protein
VRARLDSLLLAGTIPPQTWRAAVEYRATIECALGTLLGSNLGRIDTGRPPRRSGRSPQGDRSEAQLAAVRRLAGVRDSLGPVAEALLLVCVVEDLSWFAIGRRFGVDPKTGKAWVLASLRALAAIW